MMSTTATSLDQLQQKLSRSVECTYGHSQLKTGHPVRSAIHKQLNGRLVLRWVTTRESLLLYVLHLLLSPSTIWFFDAEPSVDAREPALFRNLELSFRETLNRWPHWSGQLRWAVDTDGLSTPHLGRPVITYGGNNDVGVDWTTVTCDAELDSMIPSREARSTTDKVWMVTNLPRELQAASKLAFSNLADFEGLPGVAVQLTAFKCGGWSVHIKLAHCLSDAQSLLTFMHAWAAQSRKSESILSKTVFDPEMLDRHAGTVDLEQPDPEMVAKARGLPMHRFDWWAADAPGYPDWALASSAATMPASDVLDTQQLSPSTFPPWPTWNMALPVEHVQITFSAAEVGRMKDAARNTLPSRLSEQRISRLDSLLSHIWMLINRARGHLHREDNVYLDITLGLRSRLSPPLASGFVGSPLLLAYVAKAGVDASTGPIGQIAGEIRSTLTKFTPESVSAYIHDAAYEVSPQRLWQAFLGSQHTLVTSWTQMKAYGVHFGSSTDATPQLARYVQGVMPRMDGLMQVMDLGDGGDFDISLSLEQNAMFRLLKDPLLRVFA
ncbi:hypothetical protein KCV05_g5875, partial [Aureobasidium melanogenum]